MAVLFVVATPIGNLEDITLRALRVLKEVKVVYAEDTRVTAKLFERYGIATPLERLDAVIETKAAARVIERLENGENVAYVSDAGTPGISDPGERLVAAVRSALPDAHIEPIPGASALTAALSVAGIATDSFIFLGFLPHKKGRQTALKAIAATETTVVLYESPHRILKLLGELTNHLPPERQVTIAREITKIHEEVITGSATEIKQRLEDTPEKQKGEFVVIIHPLAR